ncbi:LolA family protein [Congregibacter sp.]|uniref:LolA family protein n=1 Tax=Congregibacter sp. TaxID=2744308 RepID=UPI00385A448E
MPKFQKLQKVLTAAFLVMASIATFAEMPAISWELDNAVRQIEGQAKAFESAMASVSFVATDTDGNVLEEHSGNGFIRENGDMRYSRADNNSVVLVDGNKIFEYDGNAKTVTTLSTSKHKERLEPLYRLGFTISGRDLKDRYLLTILGEEAIGDTRTLVLELTPKRDKDRAIAGKIRLWIDQASWMPRRQEFGSTATRVTTTVDYTDMARNLELNPDLFKAKWPKGTKKIRQ